MRAVLLVGSLSALLSMACFRFTEEAPHATVTDDAGFNEVAVDAKTEIGPTLCDNYGGFPVAQAVAAATMTKAKADCRIDRFFLGMTADQSNHMQECLALQLGSIMRCSRDGVKVKYPNVDSKGVQCLDMRSSHIGKGLAIFDEDFDGFVNDITDSLAEQKVSTADLAAIADVLKFESTDIINEPPDADRGEACLPEGGTEAAVDTGSEY